MSTRHHRCGPLHKYVFNLFNGEKMFFTTYSIVVVGRITKNYMQFCFISMKKIDMLMTKFSNTKKLRNKIFYSEIILK